MAMDVSVERHGYSIIGFTPNSPAARAWLEDNIGGEATFLGDSLLCELRYAGDIAEGMLEDGLTLE